MERTKKETADAQIPEKLHTVEQVAGMLGMKPVTIRSWLNRRLIAAHKLGRSWRIPQSEIDRILAESLIPARRD